MENTYYYIMNKDTRYLEKFINELQTLNPDIQISGFALSWQSAILLSKPIYELNVNAFTSETIKELLHEVDFNTCYSESLKHDGSLVDDVLNPNTNIFKNFYETAYRKSNVDPISDDFYKLAVDFLVGDVPKQPEEGLYLMELAARLGSRDANYYMGYLCMGLNGAEKIGVKPNINEAIDYFKKSRHEEVAENDVLSLNDEEFQKLSQRNAPEAMNYLIKNRTKMTDKIIESLESKIEQPETFDNSGWKYGWSGFNPFTKDIVMDKTHNTVDENVITSVADDLMKRCLNLLGNGVSEDLSFARFYANYASKLGNKSANYILGNMYMNAIGVEQNLNVALDYLKKSEQNEQTNELIKKIEPIIEKFGNDYKYIPIPDKSNNVKISLPIKDEEKKDSQENLHTGVKVKVSKVNSTKAQSEKSSENDMLKMENLRLRNQVNHLTQIINRYEKVYGSIDEFSDDLSNNIRKK